MTTSEITGSSLTGGNLTNATSKSGVVSQDEFLKLLTYQLRSQNPLNPMDNQEFAAQLAQFSQLEQLTSIRSLMDEQVQSNYLLSQTISNSALPGLLGKTAKASSDKLYFDGEKPASLGYNLPSNASSGEIVIKDSLGKEVNSFELYEMDLTRGDHDLTWNGQDEDGSALESGEYYFEVKALDATGKRMSADTYTYGNIQSVRFKSEGTMLLLNGIEVALENVLDISTSELSFVNEY